MQNESCYIKDLFFILEIEVFILTRVSSLCVKSMIKFTKLQSSLQVCFLAQNHYQNWTVQTDKEFCSDYFPVVTIVHYFFVEICGNGSRLVGTGTIVCVR